MKKTILLIAAVVSFTSNIIAQDDDSRTKPNFGLKGGVNYSNVYDEKGEAFQADPKFGLAAGAFVSIPLGKLFAIQPEILYSQKGFKATGVILGSTYKFTRTTNYIDVPILFAVRPVEFLSIVAGPQYSYLISKKDVFANASTSIAQEQEFENDNIRKNTFCITGGLDVNVGHFVYGARAGWDVQNNNGDGTVTTPRYKNVWYQATIGYRFSK